MILGMLAIMTPFVTGVAVTMLLAVLVTAAGLTITMYAFKAGSFGKGVCSSCSAASRSSAASACSSHPSRA